MISVIWHYVFSDTQGPSPNRACPPLCVSGSALSSPSALSEHYIREHYPLRSPRCCSHCWVGFWFLASRMLQILLLLWKALLSFPNIHLSHQNQSLRPLTVLCAIDFTYWNLSLSSWLSPPLILLELVLILSGVATLLQFVICSVANVLYQDVGSHQPLTAREC